MWIQVRSFDGKKSLRVDDLSKLTKIEELRERLVDHFEAPVEKQRLFYRGKQLVDGHTLFDYNVGLNDLIQLMVRTPDSASNSQSDESAEPNDGETGDEESDKENQKPPSPGVIKEDVFAESTYKVGDVIDARDLLMGAWFESKIMNITKAVSKPDNNNLKDSSVSPVLSNEKRKDENENMKNDQNLNNNNSEALANIEPTTSDLTDQGIKPYDKLFDIAKDDGFLYHVIYEGYDEDDHVKLRCKDVRPRAHTNIRFSDIKVGDVVMANYNIEEPEQRGFWYDCVINDKQDSRTIKKLTATVYFGPDLTPVQNCKLLFVDEIFAIEEPGTQLTVADLAQNPDMSVVKRTNKPDCEICSDNPRKKCKHCACCVCGGKNEPEKQIICDECNKAYHLECMTPPLKTIPIEDEWFCPDCKNDDNEIVKAGEKLKESKKKSKMASHTGSSSRDWGRGMACVGRQKICTVVPTNHFGPVPGIEVGTMWKFRVQVSEAGIHRPHVAGIAGRENEGAYSIVLSGGYEDDTDNGDSFFYTGSGGRDLSGNKRTAEQSCDQTLTRMNKALAKNCNAPLDAKNGSTAKDWRAGKPVRVVRNCKLRKHSEYAPEEGNRYDGLYKVVKYWPEKGQSGFLVWRYLMQRDDPSPAPWTAEGKKKIKQLGLSMQYPDGYLEAQAQKEKQQSKSPVKSKSKGKRKHNDDEEEEIDNEEEEIDDEPCNSKKSKIVPYKLTDQQSKLVKQDKENKKLWEAALQYTKEGGPKFHQKLEELFTCICCQDLVFKPVTTPCCHNICKMCFQRAFKADVTTCPTCRSELGKDYKMPVNQILSDLLMELFPGYDAGR